MYTVCWFDRKSNIVFASFFPSFFETHSCILPSSAFGGEKWKTNVLLTSFLCPGWGCLCCSHPAVLHSVSRLTPHSDDHTFLLLHVLLRVVFADFFVMNLILWGEGSSAAMPFGTLVAILALWFCISVPLTFLGAYFGFKKAVSKYWVYVCADFVHSNTFGFRPPPLESTLLILILTFDYKSSASTSCKIQDSGHMLTLQNYSPLFVFNQSQSVWPTDGWRWWTTSYIWPTTVCVRTLGKSSVSSWLPDTDRPDALWSLTTNLRILRIEWTETNQTPAWTKSHLQFRSIKNTWMHTASQQCGHSTTQKTCTRRCVHTVDWQRSPDTHSYVQSRHESTPGCCIQTTRCVFGFNLPLWILQGIEHPVRTNQIPRQIPEQSFYTKPFPGIVMGGILPFGCIFIQLFFILNSIWWAKRQKRLILKTAHADECRHFYDSTVDLWTYCKCLLVIHITYSVFSGL